MAAYWVPKTPDREERIFGGVLSLRQGVYLLASLLAAAGAEALLPLRGLSLPGLIARLLAALPVVLAGTLAALGRIGRYDMNLDEALVRWWRWRRSARRYVYRRLG